MVNNMPYFDRFDICEAHYMFAMLWHTGKHSKIYAKFGTLSRIGFRPAPSLSGPENLELNGYQIYEQLLEKHGLMEL